MTNTEMTTTPSQPSRVNQPSGYTRLALHVLKQAVVDVSNRRRVNIEDLRPWAFIAGISQKSLEESFQQLAGMRRRGALS
jgi:hypothetical protein